MPGHTSEAHEEDTHIDGTVFAARDDEIVKPIQPYQARKAYICPGCTTEIAVGEGHLVVVPTPSPDLRRHWHRGCWHKEQRRRGDHRSVDAS